LGIEGEEDGAETHRDEVLVLKGVRSEVSGNIDCHQSISLVGRRRIKSEKPILVDRCRI